MKVGDLVKHKPDTGIQGIIISLCPKHREFCQPTADVYWINGMSAGVVIVQYQHQLEVISESR